MKTAQYSLMVLGTLVLLLTLMGIIMYPAGPIKDDKQLLLGILWGIAIFMAGFMIESLRMPKNNIIQRHKRRQMIINCVLAIIFSAIGSCLVLST